MVLTNRGPIIHTLSLPPSPDHHAQKHHGWTLQAARICPDSVPFVLIAVLIGVLAADGLRTLLPFVLSLCHLYLRHHTLPATMNQPRIAVYQAVLRTLDRWSVAL